MNHINILKRAFNITVNYRVLWIFGMLLALTAGGSGGGGGNSGVNLDGDHNRGFDGKNPFGELPQITPEIINTIIGVAIALACLLLVLVVVGTIARYVSENALIQMVDQYENDGTRLTFGQGFRLGWSRAAWKMFLIDLLVSLAGLAIFLLLVGIACLPLLVWLTKNTPLQVLGTIITVGLILLLVFSAILVGLALMLILIFARRACALENLGVQDSIRRGYAIVKAQAGDVILMGVMMFGARLLWSLLMIPVVLAFVLAGAIVAGLPALLVGAIVGLFTQGATPWIVAAIVGAPIFILAIVIPSALVSGWHKVFSSSAWTLTYREVLALEKTKENGEPAPAQTA
jgi:hypothetical protein